MPNPIAKTPLMETSWLQKLGPEFEKPYMKQLQAFLAEEMANGYEIFPPFEEIFQAFCFAPFEEIKVVLIGQDPYHGKGQAQGLSFSVAKGIAIPPSLQNIYKELEQDLKIPPASHGCLIHWARQGVLLLNATLTVRMGEPKSHFGKGWEIFTDRVIELLAERKDPLVFVLWGKSAAEKFHHIQKKMGPHLVLSAPHPSPFSAHSGFFGSRPFSQINGFLKKVGKEPIEWGLD